MRRWRRSVRARRLRIAYLKTLDWRRLHVRPGETEFEVNRSPRFRSRTGIAPELETAPHLLQTRQALLWWLDELGLGAEPRWLTDADIVRIARRLMPAPLRAWLDPTHEWCVTTEARRRERRPPASRSPGRRSAREAARHRSAG